MDNQVKDTSTIAMKVIITGWFNCAEGIEFKTIAIRDSDKAPVRYNNRIAVLRWPAMAIFANGNVPYMIMINRW